MVDLVCALAHHARMVKGKPDSFVPYATVRDLDRMIVNPGHAPD